VRSTERRIYSDGRGKDFKQGWFTWIVAVITMTIYTGALRLPPQA
jgi:hypothetical protein